ncbi:MAG: Cas9 inhibitor AcrIIA9 family protein [Acutalibacteraceae bacterium]
MKQLNLEAKTKEQQRIKAYLEENASDILAGKINNGVLIKKDGKILLNRKTLDGFMSFATEEARKQAEKGARYAMVEDDVVFGWAVHYFEEDSIEDTLYNEDGTEYKTQSKPAAKAPTAKAQPKPQPKPQMSMFDLMGEDLEGKPGEEKPEDDEDAMPSDEEIQEIMAEIAEEDKKKQASTSPVYRKYLDVQNRYPQAIIAMRLGDFYEVFGKNAEVLANELPLTLTGRDCGLESRVPMVGFPYHTAEMYFGKILSNGHTLVVMENDDEVRELPSAQGVDLETGEILSEEEMREFDGDIEEPKNLDNDIDTSAFDKDALCKLDEMFGDKITLR